ncbi:MAG: hypothetical protein JSW50_11415 [Candidatus Latescibacterota bacterium]|nr:MAG: hypothetical protein JSW50_11415 [Candidatus Latescibacterota bacterium]
MIKRAFTIWMRIALSAAVVFQITGCSTTYTQMATTPADEEPSAAGPYEEAYFEDYQELSSYGVWTVIEPLGWVWRPTVVSGWRPYFYGHWLWSNWGWTWVSYEPFGWAVYHYGYWHYDPIWGWLWLPGDKWFSARVKWMVYDDYVCWAPSPPPGYYIGDPWQTNVHFIWNAVPARHFTSSSVHNFSVRPPRPAIPILDDDYRHRREPSLRFIENHTNKKVKPAQIDVRDVKTGSKTYKRMVLPPGEKRKVDRYQPRIEKQVIPKNPETETKQPKKRTTSSKSQDKRSTKSRNTTDAKSTSGTEPD